ncbi:MAG TPA: TonB-dependent receptor, partial [Steroidobacteraceae bacterium]
TAHAEKKRLFGVVEWDPTANGTLTLGGSYEWDDDRPAAQGWPLYPPGKTLPRDRPFVLPWEFDRKGRSEIYLQYRQQLAPDWNVRFNSGSWHVRETNLLASFPDYPDMTRPMQPSVGYTGQDPLLYRMNTVDVTVTGVLNPLGMRTEVAIGADYSDFYDRAHSFGASFGPPILYPRDFAPENYPNPLPGGPSGVYSLPQQNWQKAYGAFASIKTDVTDAWSVTAGARVSSDTNTSASPSPFSPYVSLGTRGAITPLASVMYRIDAHYSWYASYADAYGTIGNSEISQGKAAPPEGEKTAETGVKGVWRNGALNGTLALYWAAESGIPSQFDSPYPKDPGCCVVQTSSIVSQGAEIELTGEIQPGWLLATGYTYSRLASPFEGLLTFYPRHLLKFWTSKQLQGYLERWTVGGAVRALSSIELTETTNCQFRFMGTSLIETCSPLVTKLQPAYAVVDLRAGFRIDDHWQVALTINNALNKNYFESYGTEGSEGWYGAPRNFMVRFDGKF